MSEIISIALATYNGSKYIREMLDSISQQTYSAFVIHICDDGSTDNTLELIKSHNLYIDGKIRLHDINGGNGALKNFKRTIEYCSGEYIALCDQDDYWVPEKLEILLSSMQKAELVSAGPKLVFSDLEISDSYLECIYPSFYAVSGKSNECSKARDFLLSNHIPGCAMMFNKKIKTLIEPIPDSVRMHDWWIVLLAAFYGEIIFVPQILIKYRQHDHNTIGASGMISQRINLLQFMKNIKTVIQRSRNLQNSFKIRHDSITAPMSPGNNDFLSIVDRNISLVDKLSMLKYVRSGEGKLLAFIVWWFI